jgi:hypothetical protein
VNLRTPPAAQLAPDVLSSHLESGAHLVHLYHDDACLLGTLEAFVAGGLHLGEAVVVIATTPHLAALRVRLRARGFDMATLQMFDQFMALDAGELLARFMTAEGPDPLRFESIAEDLLARARLGGRPVRAFGEMVALLWQDGRATAALQLERLWQHYCDNEGLPLLCAYPKGLFDAGDSTGIRDVCAAHSALVIA